MRKPRKPKPEWYLQKESTAKLFGSICYICRKRFKSKFTFHHKWYIPDEKTYKDFKSSKEYNKYVLPIVRKDPQRFRLLCNAHHTAVEKLKRYKKDTYDRLIEVTDESRYMD